jgi:hypothetical protein
MFQVQLVPRGANVNQQEQTFTFSQPNNQTGKGAKAGTSTEFWDIPWKAIFHSRQVWAIIVVQFCQSWSFWLLITWLPTYYKDMFHIDMKHIGVFTGK